LVHALGPVRDPAAADLEIADAELREELRNAAVDHRRQLAQHRKRMAGRMDRDELIENVAAGLVAAEGVDRDRRIERLRFFVERMELRAAEILAVRLGGEHAAAKAQLRDRAPQ